MPKKKTHSGSKKRFKITGSGKVLRERAGKRHLLEHKPSTLTRRLCGNAEMAPADAKKMLEFIVLAIEARRQDWLRELTFHLEVGQPDLWALPQSVVG